MRARILITAIALLNWGPAVSALARSERRCIIVTEVEEKVSPGNGACPGVVKEVGGDTGLSALETVLVEDLGVPTSTSSSASQAAKTD